jgi:hypothetical protein
MRRKMCNFFTNFGVSPFINVGDLYFFTCVCFSIFFVLRFRCIIKPIFIFEIGQIAESIVLFVNVVNLVFLPWPDKF